MGDDHRSVAQRRTETVGSPLVEILYFVDCPNYKETQALVKTVAAELGVEAMIELVDVPDEGTAVRRRFLGSPTVRVDGHDVEPGAEERTEFALCCRVYRTVHGLAGHPDRDWIRRALEVTST